MAIVTTSIREIQFDDGSIVKLREGESIREVVARLEADGVAVTVF